MTFHANYHISCKLSPEKKRHLKFCIELMTLIFSVVSKKKNDHFDTHTHTKMVSPKNGESLRIRKSESGVEGHPERILTRNHRFISMC